MPQYIDCVYNVNPINIISTMNRKSDNIRCHFLAARQIFKKNLTKKSGNLTKHTREISSQTGKKNIFYFL